MPQVEIPVGRHHWSLDIPDGSLIPVSRADLGVPVDPAVALREAVEHPVGFVPLRQALTPDDRVTVAVDPSLPHLGELLGALLGVLAEAGVTPERVTLLAPPGHRTDWWEGLPDELDDAHVEDHDPTRRERISYLATTADGRRIYLNRALVDADFCVLLTARRHDPVRGPVGGVDALFPTLSDADTRGELLDRFVPGEGAAARAEAESREAAAMLGIPLFVQVIAGAGDDIVGVIAGLADSGDLAASREHDLWHARIDRPARTVIASVSGDPALVDFAVLSRALACAARAVVPGGRIVLLAESALDAVPMIRGDRSPAASLERLMTDKPPGWQAALGWAGAAQRAKLFLHGGPAHDMFATPIDGPDDLPELGDELLILPDAHKMWISLDSDH